MVLELGFTDKGLTLFMDSEWLTPGFLTGLLTHQKRVANVGILNTMFSLRKQKHL